MKLLWMKYEYYVKGTDAAAVIDAEARDLIKSWEFDPVRDVFMPDELSADDLQTLYNAVMNTHSRLAGVGKEITKEHFYAKYDLLYEWINQQYEEVSRSSRAAARAYMMREMDSLEDEYKAAVRDRDSASANEAMLGMKNFAASIDALDNDD